MVGESENVRNQQRFHESATSVDNSRLQIRLSAHGRALRHVLLDRKRMEVGSTNMESSSALCLAPVMLDGADYDNHSWATRMQGWLASLPDDAQLWAGAFCELMREALDADRAGMYLKSLSILSRAERLLADCDSLDSFIYAMGGTPRRIPTDPGGGPRNTQPGPTGGGGTSSGNPCDSTDDDACSQCIGGLCLYGILNAICGGGCS